MEANETDPISIKEIEVKKEAMRLKMERDNTKLLQKQLESQQLELAAMVKQIRLERAEEVNRQRKKLFYFYLILLSTLLPNCCFLF